jgi:hypothetical protein
MVALGLLWPTAASSLPGVGPHETVSLRSSTTKPDTPAAVTYRGRYHAAGDENSDPPALRRLVIKLPRGSKIDTAVPGRCEASDSELMFEGESACPTSSRIGKGAATLRQLGLGPTTYDTVVFNAKDEQLEVIKSGDMVLAVLHTEIRGRTLDATLPTCLSGGQPPDGCPADQTVLLSNYVYTKRITTGHGANRRAYGTTPRRCPPSGRVKSHVTLYFGDGSMDEVAPTQRCDRP